MVAERWECWDCYKRVARVLMRQRTTSLSVEKMTSIVSVVIRSMSKRAILLQEGHCVLVLPTCVAMQQLTVMLKQHYLTMHSGSILVRVHPPTFPNLVVVLCH